ncbi:MAG TPA: Clp protease N-terminal domain-containing protein [Solirubrobacteraceae bacterium]|nr:Clp protease N-terminal domain-containing protein [Solirubrobacteraceae bacterium]
MRITEDSRRVVKLAVDEARKRGDHEWGREHVLLALCQLSDEPEMRGAKVLGRLGIDERRVREALDRYRPPGPELDETPLEAGGPPNQQTFAAHEIERVFMHTRWLAAHFGRRAADTEHLLLGVLAEDRPEDRVLADLGVRFEDVYHALTGAPPAEEIAPCRPVVIPIEDFNSALRMLPKVLPAAVTYSFNFDDKQAWFYTDWDVDLEDYIKLALARA